MIIFVVDKNNNIGHPTRKCDMIRRLLKHGKAKIIGGGLKPGQPIIVKLDQVFDKSKTIDCEFKIEIDQGHNYIRYCIYKIVDGETIKLFSDELENRSSDVRKFVVTDWASSTQLKKLGKFHHNTYKRALTNIGILQ